MAIQEDLTLDTTAALDAIAGLGSALTDALAVAGDALAASIVAATDALTGLDVTVTPNVDAAAAVDQLTLDFEAVQPTVEVTPTFPADVLQGEVADALEAGIQQGAATVPDTSTLTDAIASGVETGIVDGVDAGAQNAGDAVDKLGSSAEAAGGKISSGLAGGAGSLTGIELAAAAAAGNIGNVGSSLKELAPAIAPVAVLGAGLFEVAKTAENLRASEERLNLVFGDQAAAVQQVNVGGLTGDLADLTVQAGGSVASMNQATASIGQFGHATGASNDQITQTTNQIQALGLRAVALNPALGDAGDVTDRLSRVLASGRTRGLIPFGLSLDQVAAKALAQQNALADGRSEITRFDLAAAGATLITQQLGDKIGTDFAGGVQQSGVQLKALRATLEETLATAGQPILGPLIDDAKALLPVAQALGITLGALFDILAKIPAPVLSTVAALAAFGFGTKAILSLVIALGGALGGLVTTAVGAGAALLGLGETAGTVGEEVAVTEAQITGGLSVIGAVVGAAVVGLGLFSSSSKRATDDSKDLATGFLGVGAAAGQAVTGIADFASNLQKEFDKGTKSDSEFVRNLSANNATLLGSLASAGIGVEQLAGFLTSGRAGAAAFTSSILASDPALHGLADAAHAAGLSQSELLSALHQVGGAQDAFGIKTLVLSKELGLSGDQVRRVASELGKQTDAFRAAQRAVDDLAKAELARDLSSGKITQSEFDKATASGRYADALAALGPTIDTNTALQAQQANQNALSAGAWDNLARAVAAGKVTLENLPDIADKFAQFGVAAADVDAFAKSVQTAIDGVVKQAESGIPAASDAIQAFSDGINAAFQNLQSTASKSKVSAKDLQDAKDAYVAATDPQRIIDNLNKTRTEILEFNTNLVALFRSGNLRAAQEAANLGPQAGAAFAAGLVKGGPQVEAAANAQLLGIDRAAASRLDFVRTTLAPQLVGAYGQAGTDALGQLTFNIGGGGPSQAAIDTALKSSLHVFGAASPQFAQAAAALGVSQSDAYQAALDLGGPASTALARIPALIHDVAPSISTETAALAAELTNNFGGNVATIPVTVQVALAQAVANVQAAAPNLDAAAVNSAISLARGFGEELTGGKGIPAAGTAAYHQLVLNLIGATPGLRTTAAATAIAAAAAFTGGLDQGLAGVQTHVGDTISAGIRKAESRESDFGNAGKSSGKALGDSLQAQLGTSIAAGAEQARAGGALIGNTLGGSVVTAVNTQGPVVSIVVGGTVVKAASGGAVVATAAGTGIGDALGQGIIDGVLVHDAEIQQAVMDLIHRAETAARATAGIHSPSTLFAAIGREISAGVASGIGSAKDLPAASVKSLILSLANQAADTAVASVSGVAERLIRGIGTAATAAVVHDVDRSEHAALTALTTGSTAIVGSIEQAVTSLGNVARAGLTTGQTSLADAVKPVGDQIEAAITAERTAVAADFEKGVKDPIVAALAHLTSEQIATLDRFIHGPSKVTAVAATTPVATPVAAAPAAPPTITAAQAATELTLVVHVAATPDTSLVQAHAIGTAVGTAAADTLARTGVIARVQAG